MEIKTDPEFQDLIPKISNEEFKGLEESIINEGCRDSLVLWDNILLDGHNRYEICTRHEIPFKTIIKCFDDRDQAKLWIICNQLGRRNLAPEQISYLRGLKWKLTDKQPGERTDLTSRQSGARLKSIAKEHGVSSRTIERDAKFAEAVDKLPEEERKEVLAGKSRKTKKEVMGIMEREIIPKNKKEESESKDSNALWNLKRWWKKASNRDQASFKKWIDKN